MADGYIARHWRGELTLPVSFWVNNCILALPVGFAIGALAAWIAVTGDYLRGGSIALLVAWPLLLLFSVWSIVGAWRAATAHSESGGSGLWAGLAKLLLALSALSTTGSAVFDFVPNVGDWLRMARGIDPIGHVQATLSADGRRLRLEGPLGLGDAERIRALTAKAGGLRIVELDSPGGRLKEGEEIAALVKRAAWHTRTTGACESACTLVHMAGERKQLLPGAKIGFHRASAGTVNPVLDNLANRELVRIYREAGLPERFIERTLATPASRMWYPSRDELVGAGLVSLAERPLDIELPESAKAPASEYADAMTGSDTWLAVDKRYPGAMALAARRMVEARAGGADAAEVQVQGQKVIEQHLPALLAEAGPELRESYLALLALQLSAARAAAPAAGVAMTTTTSTSSTTTAVPRPGAAAAPTACIGVLAADAGARRALSPDLVQREAAWLIAAAAAAPTREIGGRAPSTVEQEVLRRRLGERSPALLAQAWQPGALQRPARDCERAIELLRAVAELPPAERRLATRLMFGRG
ncbi:MAG: hypothetical protein HZC37_11530 [Burkholderiales bacterium]|nr:hypothetical protein [Burkholderiales bacterium]